MNPVSFRPAARVFANLPVSLSAILLGLQFLPGHAVLAQGAAAPAPIVLTGADRRPATSLNGEWGAVVDPYFSGLFSFHH